MFIKTHGRVYLICPQQALSLHELEYRIEFLSAVKLLDYSVMTL